MELRKFTGRKLFSTRKVYGHGAPAGLVSCTSGIRSCLSNAFRFATSKDCTNTFASGRFRPLRLSVFTSSGSSARPCCWKYVGCLVSG